MCNRNFKKFSLSLSLSIHYLCLDFNPQKGPIVLLPRNFKTCDRLPQRLKLISLAFLEGNLIWLCSVSKWHRAGMFISIQKYYHLKVETYITDQCYIIIFQLGTCYNVAIKYQNTLILSAQEITHKPLSFSIEPEDLISEMWDFWTAFPFFHRGPF